MRVNAYQPYYLSLLLDTLRKTDIKSNPRAFGVYGQREEHVYRRTA